VLNLLSYYMTKSIKGAEFSVLGEFRGRFPLSAPLKFELDHFSSKQVVPFVELNLLSYYMTKSIKGAEFWLWGVLGGSSPPCPIKIEFGPFFIKPSCCICRAESFELLHDEIYQGAKFRFWGVLGGRLPSLPP
jgi:hypothetical protein